MGTTFADLDARVRNLLKRTHDYLWMGEEADPAALRQEFSAVAAAWEDRLGASVGVANVTRVLSQQFGRNRETEALYTFTQQLFGLTAAALLLKKGHPTRAVARCSEATDGTSIHFAAAFGHHDYVEARDRGDLSYEAFLAEVADLLEEKGATRVGQYKRLVLLVWETHQEVSGGAWRGSRELAARTAVYATATALERGASLLEELGMTTATPSTEYTEIVESILDAAL